MTMIHPLMTVDYSYYKNKGKKLYPLAVERQQAIQAVRHEAASIYAKQVVYNKKGQINEVRS